ncbi:hypothetical protein H9636_07080 [Ureibacillus sp. Re31]|uniref:Phage-related protein n=1 Tax=Ureibacillus galli TaxID=2762222 RepID=A0ABR8XAV9_9BACL|nr:hypothetical protein [Ureibacillus galli]MBD8026420.1 hypothetical protein [Ureibacillus galli]
MSVRDLNVDIDVDVDDNPLRDLDSLVNDVKLAFSGIDASGLSNLEREVEAVNREMADFSREIREADRAMNNINTIGTTSVSKLDLLFQKIDNDVNNVNIELNQLLPNLVQLRTIGNISITHLNHLFNRLQLNLGGVLRDINPLTAALAVLGVAGVISMNLLINKIQDLELRLNLLEMELKELRNQSTQVTVATSLMGNAMSIAGLKGVAMGGLITSAMAGIVAMAAPLVVLVGGLAASLMAAGFAAVAFGAVAMGALGPVIMGAEDLTKAQAAARKELESFVDFWKGFVKQFEAPIFEMFGTGLQLVQNILKGLAPTITNVADVVNELLTSMNESVVGGGLQNFFYWLEVNGADSLRSFALIFGNIFSGLFDMIGAFSPIGAEFEEGLISMAERYAEWSDKLAASNGFQKFIDYAIENGPVLMSLLGDLFGVLGDVIVGLAPLGTVVLAGLAVLFDYLNSNLGPVFSQIGEEVSFLADVFMNQLLPVILPIAEQVLPVLGQAFENIKNLGMALFEAFLSILPTLQDIFETVLPIAIDLFQRVYETIGALINNVVIPLLPMIGTVISEVWSVVKPILEPLKNLISTIGDTIMFLINEVVSPLIPVIGKVLGAMWKVAKPILDAIFDIFGNIIDAVSSTIQAVKDLASAFTNFKIPSWVKELGGTISGAISKVGSWLDGSHASGLGRVPFDGYVAELHKDEAVLTADQSNALRDLGVLKGDGSSPELDLSNNNNGGSYKTTYNTSSSHNSSSAQVQIFVQGSDNPKETARSIREELEDFFADLNIIMPTPREG